MSVLDRVFKAYDIRGLAPGELDADLAWRIGAAFARFAVPDRERSRGSVLVARDMRSSGVELAESFSDGARSQGVDVVDLGLASTDLLYFASGHLDAPGAIFTASHNPAEYNGIKLCLAGAAPVGEDTGLAEIRTLVEDDLPAVDEPGERTEQDLLPEFARHVHSFVDRAVLRPLKVVADTANGMGGLVVPAVLDGLPFEVDVLYGELDGTFPNHPADPLQEENLKDLQARVLETGADVGLAFDGDADRVFFVDEQANPVSGSLTTALLAQGMLEKHPGAKIIHNLICSRVVPEVITELGGVPIRTRVGHSFIKAKMAETGAVFGGEHSAHYYFRENWRADSGLIAAVVVLERMSKEGRPLSAVIDPLRRYVQSGEINTRVDDPLDVVEQVAEHYRDLPQDRVDGLTVDGGPWWFNLRPSNTEPLLRLNLEAPTREECDRRVGEVQQAMTGSG